MAKFGDWEKQLGRQVPGNSGERQLFNGSADSKVFSFSGGYTKPAGNGSWWGLSEGDVEGSSGRC